MYQFPGVIRAVSCGFQTEPSETFLRPYCPQSKINALLLKTLQDYEPINKKTVTLVS